MKGNKAKVMRKTEAINLKTGNIKELYQYFEKKYGGERQEGNTPPRELGRQLASELMKKIDEKVVIK